MRGAAQIANALNFILANPDGFQREVGYRGEHLSGGERQRIAIARVVSLKPSVYIFDEMTNALDNQNGLEVQSKIDNIADSKTSISITHQLKFIKNSHCIL